MSDLNDALKGNADAGHSCPDGNAECPASATDSLNHLLKGGQWELKAWSDKMDPTSKAFQSIFGTFCGDETSHVEGEPQDVEALRLLQKAPVRWDLLEEALGLDASPESITFDFSEDPDNPGLTATVRLIPSPHRQRSTVDDTAVPCERQISSAPGIMPLARAALVQPPHRVTDARVGAEGREAYDSYGGTD